MEWTERTAVIGPQIARSIQRAAEDGHLILADLIEAQGAAQGPTVVVTCEPVTFDDGAEDLERFPTLQELVDAVDELAPGFLFGTQFPSFPIGQRPPPPPGARAVPLTAVGRIRTAGAIEVVGSIPS